MRGSFVEIGAKPNNTHVCEQSGNDAGAATKWIANKQQFHFVVLIPDMESLIFAPTFAAMNGAPRPWVQTSC